MRKRKRYAGQGASLTLLLPVEEHHAVFRQNAPVLPPLWGRGIIDQEKYLIKKHLTFYFYSL